MTPTAIVATAAREGLSIIAVTDHNEIANVEPNSSNRFVGWDMRYSWSGAVYIPRTFTVLFANNRRITSVLQSAFD